VVNLLSKIQFFKDRQISKKDMVELVPFLKIHPGEEGQEMVTYGEKGDRFFIILKGSVSVLVPNSKISGWRMQRFLYN